MTAGIVVVGVIVVSLDVVDDELPTNDRFFRAQSSHDGGIGWTRGVGDEGRNRCHLEEAKQILDALFLVVFQIVRVVGDERESPDRSVFLQFVELFFLLLVLRRSDFRIFILRC